MISDDDDDDLQRHFQGPSRPVKVQPTGPATTITTTIIAIQTAFEQ